MFALLFYRLLLLLLLPLILLFMAYRSKNNRGYRQRLSERLGFFPKSAATSPLKKHGIIVHAASVGEVIALKPLVEQLLSCYPNLAITFTTFTPTGSAQVIALFGSRVQHGYLPFDIYPCTQLFLARLQPKLVIFMETELWPNLIAQCQNKDIKLMLVNARLSKRSVHSYKKLTALITPALNSFDKILAQSQDNLSRFLELGANDKHCKVAGNIKFDLSISTTVEAKSKELAQYLPKDRPIWLVASTHDGDEKIALATFTQLLRQFPHLLLVLVPRHPERFTHVQQMCSAQGFNVALRSDETVVNKQHIWLLDSLGELLSAYALADIITMGGSFNKVGGHNPLEPALFKKPIVVGNNMSNFVEITQLLLQQKGIVQLPSDIELTSACSNQTEQLTNEILLLLQNSNQQLQLGKNAYKIVRDNQGACLSILKDVQALLPKLAVLGENCVSK